MRMLCIIFLLVVILPVVSCSSENNETSSVTEIPTIADVTTATISNTTTTTTAVTSTTIKTEETKTSTSLQTYEDSVKGSAWSIVYPEGWTVKSSTNRIQKLSETGEIIAELLIDPEHGDDEYTADPRGWVEKLCVENYRYRGIGVNEMTVGGYHAFQTDWFYDDDLKSDLSMTVVCTDFNNDFYMIGARCQDSIDRDTLYGMVQSIRLFPK